MNETEDSTPRVIVSTTHKRYALLPSASDRLLRPPQLRAVGLYLSRNRTQRFTDRDAPPAAVIPPLPFTRCVGAACDEVLRLTACAAPVREVALDVPIRLSAPDALRAPPLADPPTRLPLASRIAALLKGREAVPMHWHSAKTESAAEARPTVLPDTSARVGAARRAGLTAQQARLDTLAAAMHYNSGNMELARDHFARALPAFDAAGDVVGVAFCHNLLGVCLARVGAHRTALVHHKLQEALAGCYARAVAEINMAVSYAALGELRFAAQALDDALANARACEDALLETIALGNRGLVCLRMGNMRTAQTSLEQCLEKCSLAGDKGGAAVCLLLLGELYSLMQDHQHALFYYEHAFRVGGEAGCGDVVDVARVSIGIARGDAALRQAVMMQAESMGQQTDLKDVVALLPP